MVCIGECQWIVKLAAFEAQEVIIAMRSSGLERPWGWLEGVRPGQAPARPSLSEDNPIESQASARAHGRPPSTTIANILTMKPTKANIAGPVRAASADQAVSANVGAGSIERCSSPWSFTFVALFHLALR
jgi:hypothetical protein